MNSPTLTPNSQVIAADANLDHYLRSTNIVDWQHPAVLEQARRLAESVQHYAIAQTCFEWVRDTIRHSFDYQLNPVTYRASDVLKHRTGYCYAKSHLLAALLRANGIPTGFCYQRLSIDDTGAPYCLHGLNGVYLPQSLPNGDWYRVDPRGNKDGVNAQFCPPVEQLAFAPQCPEEVDFVTVLPDPLPVVLDCLNTQPTWDQVLDNLPDIELSEAKAIGLTEGRNT